MANKDNENKIEKFTKEAIGKTLNQFNKEIGMTDLVEVNKNQDRILNGILSQVNDENTEKIEKSNIITLDNSTDGIVELKEIQGDTNVNVSKIEEMPITHDIGDKEGNVFTLNEITQGAISIGEIQGNTMVNCNKDDKKELVLMKDLSTQGDNNITLTEGVDGGLVDVALEGNTLVNVSKTKNNYITHEREEDITGNHIALADEGYIRPVLNGKTMVNVCDQKEPIAVTKSYTVENSGNHVALQGEYDGKCRPVVTGNTLVNLASNSNLWEVGCSGDVNTDYTITSTDDQGIVIDKLTDNVDYLYFRKRIDPNLFKSNTTYTIIFNSSKAYRVGIVSGNTAEVVLPLSPCNDGYNTIIVTSTDLSTVTGTAPIYAYLSINKQYIGTAKVSDFIALEGDYSDKPIPDYFEGLQSSFEDRVVPERLAHFPSTILTTPSSGYTHREFGDTLSLKPSTTYTIVQKAHKTTNHSPVNTNAHPYTLVFGGRQGVSDSWIVRANPPVGDIKEGVSAYTLTTPNDFVISTQTFMVIVEENKGSEFELEVSIFEGDYTNYNFSDYDPTKVGKYRVDYKVTGKNKAYGLKQQIPDVLTTKINVTKGKSYTYSTQNIADGTCRISICNSEPYNSESLSNAEIQLISDWGGGNHTWVSEVTGTVWFIIWQRDITINSNSTLQIEEGTTSTSYEPYKEATKTLYLNSPLLEGDTIEQQNNNIVHVHRYSKVVLDGGTSPWGNTWWESTSNTTDTVFSGGLSSAPYEDISYCDKLLIVTPSNLSSYDTAITIDGESIIRINIPKELLSRNKDLSAFRTWLTNNPVTLVGRLKTPQYEVISTNDELLTDSYVNGHLDFESAVPVEKVKFDWVVSKGMRYLYPSTTYDIYFESDNIGIVSMGIYNSWCRDLIVSKGKNKVTLQFGESIKDNRLIMDGIGFNASNIVVTPAIEQDFGYFSGLSSAFEDGLVTQEMVDSGEEVADNLGKYRVDYKVTGKNKLNLPSAFNEWDGGKIAVTDGNVVTFTPNSASNQSMTYQTVFTDANFKKGTQLTLSATKVSGVEHTSGTYAVGLYLKDVNGNEITDMPNTNCPDFTPSSTVGTIRTTTMTFTQDVAQIGLYAIAWSVQGASGDTVFKLQLEYGDTATAYEPYKEYAKTLYLNSPLLKGDTIEEKDGGIYHVHRYGKVILDGSDDEHWSTMSNWSGYFEDTLGYTRFQLSQSGLYFNLEDTPITIISDKFPSISNINWKTLSEHIENDDKKINIVTTKASAVYEFKSWLQQNPVTAVYKLAEPQYELIEQSNIAVPSYSNGHLDLASAVPVSKVNFLHFEEELTYLYPSTSYTVQFMSDKAITIDMVLGGTELLAQNIVKGLNRISITTPDTLVDNKLVIDGVGANISEVVVTDTNREFAYFEGMKSVGECEELEVKSGNKNLYNFDWTIINTKNDYGTSNGYFGTIQKLKPNTKYYITIKNDNNIVFDDNYAYAYISGGMYGIIWTVKPNGSIYGNYSGEITTDNTGFVYFRASNKGLDFLNKLNQLTFQIEEGSTATDYIPHQSNAQQLSHEPLRAIGEVKDRYVLIDGKWYIERNCKEDFIDGSDKYYWMQGGEGDTNNGFTVYSRLEGLLQNSGISSDIKVLKGYEITTSSTNFLYCNMNTVVINVTGKTSVAEVKSYINSNPITLVHGISSPTYEPIDYNPFEVYSGTTHITTNSVIPTNIIIKNHGFNCLLKPSTTYTISSNLGLNTVTTGADIGDSCLRFYNEDTSDITTMKNVLVLEGDWTSKADLIPSNFSGIESAFEQELVTDESDVNYGKYKVNAKVVGKNLIPYWLLGKYDKFSGTTEWSNNYIRTPLIHVHERQYIFSRANDKAITILTYDKNKEFLKCIIDKTFKSKQITLDNNVHYIAIHYYTIEASDILQNIDMELNQLEQGDTATTYEPYKESDVTFYLNEPLRGVENSKDRVYVKDDKVVVQRNCASVTFNDSNRILLHNNNDKTIEFLLPSSINKTINNMLCVCNTLPYKASGTDERVTPYATGIYITINKNKLSTQDEVGLRQWLQQHPTTVVYQLAEPTYEEVEYSSNRLILDTFNNESFNNSTLFLDTTILPKLSFKPLYEELVYVKSNTKYYIQFNAVGSGEVIINLGGTELTTEIVEGYNCIPVTTPSEATNLMTIIGQGITISEVVVSEVICGGYYKGLQSCFEEHMENGKYRVLLRGIALDGSKVNGIKLYINEPLRGVGDTKDRLCIKNGKLMVERKCGEVKLDENSNIMSISGLYLENTVIFKLDIPIKNYDYYICDNFECYYSMSLSNKDIEGTYSFDNSIRFRILRSKLNGESYDDFKQWLQQNPVTVVYQLAEPTYEEVTNEYGLPIVFEGYENGIVYIDSAVTPTTHIKYTSNNQLATTLSEAEEQNIATQEDINMNVVTYMMDIDMILTEMEMSNDTSVMAVRRDSSNENMLDRMSEEDKKVYRDNTVVMLEKMITANVLEKEDIEGRIDMYYNKNRISKEQYEYLKSLL